jgi:1-deoxy-D-xylulose-5-phosphate reductoisomerase
MVEFRDGSILAQLGVTDMRHPIQYALTWPERWSSRLPPLDLPQVGRLDFEAPDTERFPCLGLAYQALRSGGRAPAVLNAANEVAVEAFLRGAIALPDIASLVEETLDGLAQGSADSLEAVLQADREAREWAGRSLARSTEAQG